jgi:hypothetical protein
MLQFGTNIRKPINLRPDVNRLIGHCQLSLDDDGKVCVILTEKYYTQDLGARSLANAVKEVEHELSIEYSSLDGLVTEDVNSGPLQCFTVRPVPITDDVYEVGVYADGSGDSTMRDVDRL